MRKELEQVIGRTKSYACVAKRSKNLKTSKPHNLMKSLVVLLGPTAVGKTELSLSLAEMLGSPIINCDSRQLFADLRIGTAAPTPEQLQRVRHYFVGTLKLEDYYNAAQYEADVLQLTSELFQTHNTLLL